MEINCIYNCNYCDVTSKIKDESVDLILTDIPYLISRETRFKEIKNYTKKDGNSNYYGMSYEFDDTNFSDIESYIKECCRILKKGGNLIVWSSWQLMGDLEELIRNELGNNMREPRIGVWIKNNPLPANVNRKAVNAIEMFICVAKGANATFNLTPYRNRILNGKIEVVDARYDDSSNELELKNGNLEIKNGTQIFNNKIERLVYIEPKVPDGIRIHPTEKPLNIIRHLIETYSNKDDLVYDGLLGSGVTAQASKITGRNYIGTEINKEYFEKANSRLIERNN